MRYSSLCWTREKRKKRREREREKYSRVQNKDAIVRSSLADARRRYATQRRFTDYGQGRRVPSSSLEFRHRRPVYLGREKSRARQRREQGSQRVCGTPQLLRILIKVPDDSSEPPRRRSCVLCQSCGTSRGTLHPIIRGREGSSRGTLRVRRQSTSAGCDIQIKRDSEC